MHVENTITIERPIEEVFEYVSTPENDPTWVSASIRNQRTLPGPMRVGMTTEEDVKIFGRTSRDTWEVTEYEPPTVIAYRATSGLLSGGVVRLRCEPVEGGTRLTHAVEYEPRAAASSCAPCALNSLQRSSAPITCPPLRLVGAEGHRPFALRRM